MNKTRYEDLFSTASVVALNTKPAPSKPVVNKPNRKKARRASRTEIVQINSLLNDYLVKRDDGTYEYSNDMSDDKIAKFVHPELNQDHVGNARRQLYGSLYLPQTQPTKQQDMLYRIVMLETKLDRLIKYLEDGLGYNAK